MLYLCFGVRNKAGQLCHDLFFSLLSYTPLLFHLDLLLILIKYFLCVINLWYYFYTHSSLLPLYFCICLFFPYLVVITKSSLDIHGETFLIIENSHHDYWDLLKNYYSLKRRWWISRTFIFKWNFDLLIWSSARLR